MKWLSDLPPEPKYVEGHAIIHELKKLWPALEFFKCMCPARTIVDDNWCFRGEHRLFHIIVHLNDYHGWSREQIADWLETLDCDLKLKER